VYYCHSVIRKSPPPLPGGDSVEKKSSKSSVSHSLLAREEDEDRDPPDSHRGKTDPDWTTIPDLGNVNLTSSSKSVYLPDYVAVRIRNLNVSTGKYVLATVYFGKPHADQGLYIDNIWVSYTSFLEFDTSGVSSYIGAYVFTRVDYGSIIGRIGFYDKELGRRAAKSQYWGYGWYRISVDKYREWNPPMVPEPSAYGAALLGLGLGAVVLNRRRVKKARTGSALGAVPV